MNKNYLIIAILAAVIAVLCIGIGYVLFAEHTEYMTTTIPESGTVLEIPKDMTVKSNTSGIIVLENDNTIVILFNSANKGLAELMAYATIKSSIFGNNGEGNITLNNPRIAACSLDGECNAFLMGNNDTHDNIIVVSKDKKIVNHIIASIKWGIKTESSENTDSADTSETSNSQPTAYAYKSDGTPMYSQSEVDDYMLNKYGMVDYHVGENGYIDMDEAGYDNAGNPI